MKKIAALLALVICLLAAVPAMAMRTNMVRVALQHDWRQLLSAEELANTEGNGVHRRLRVELLPLGQQDIRPGETPDLDDNTKDALLTAAENALNPRNGETMYYAIMNAQAQIKSENGDNWEDTNIPAQTGDDHQYQSLETTIPFDLFGFDSNDRIAAFVASTDNNEENVTTEKCYDRMKSEGAGMLFPHLTPMIFAWVPQEGPAAAPLEAPDMPSTGDNGNLAMLFVLLGVSVAALSAMKLRRREN